MRRLVGIRKAKENLSRYIRLAQEGDEVVITDRGDAVVRLVAISPASRRRTLDDVLGELADSGLLEQGEGKLRPARPVRRR